jgi:hypothetical protein
LSNISSRPSWIISVFLKIVLIIEWLPDDFARPKCVFQELVDERSNLFPQAWKVNNCWLDIIKKSNQYSDVVLTFYTKKGYYGGLTIWNVGLVMLFIKLYSRGHFGKGLKAILWNLLPVFLLTII